MDVLRRRLTTFAAAVVLAAVGATVPVAGPAAAGPPVTRCSELREASAGTVVDGDLLVDVGPCELRETVVHGDVRVIDTPETYLLMSGSTIDGTLRVAGPVQLYATRVRSVVFNGPRGVLSANEGSFVERDVRGTGEELSLFRSDVGGGVHVRTRQNTLQEATVARDVRLSDGHAWIWGSTLGGDLRVTRAMFFFTMCGTTVAGNVTMRQAAAALDVGLPLADSPYACTDFPEYPTVTTVGGTLTLADNRAEVRLADLHVAGDLVCRANTGPGGVTVLDMVTVDGARRGQCAPRL